MTATLEKPQRRLQLRNLTDNDIAKIGAFLRVGRDRLQCDWSVVFDGAFHALVVGAHRHDAALQAAHEPAGTLHVLDAREGHESAALARPLQYDLFIDALSDTERNLVGNGDALPTLAASVLPASTPARDSAQPSSTFSVSREARLRLRRWPPAAMLCAHRYNVRLASFMSGRHIGLEELVQLSNVDQPLCEQFLVALRDADLLDIALPEAGSPWLPMLAAPAAASPGRGAADNGLFSRIRSRLGLERPE
jgi:hypothetical protein